MKSLSKNRSIPPVLFSVILTFGACGGGNDFPMKARSELHIPNGESLRYGVYQAGEKIQDFRMVTFFEGKDKAHAYLDMHNIDSKKGAPATYKEFGSYSIVDLKNASMVKYYMDNYDYRVSEKKQEGNFLEDVVIEASTLTHISREWDGNEVHETKNVVNDIESGYPIWTPAAFSLWGGRLLNWNDGGSILTVVPIQKRPFKSYLVPEGEEEITTPAGVFKTTKLRWRISNFFIDLLLRVFTDKLYMWVEKGDAHRLIQVRIPGDQMWVLEEATIVK